MRTGIRIRSAKHPCRRKAIECPGCSQRGAPPPGQARLPRQDRREADALLGAAEPVGTGVIGRRGRDPNGPPLSHEPSNAQETFARPRVHISLANGRAVARRAGSPPALPSRRSRVAPATRTSPRPTRSPGVPRPRPCSAMGLHVWSPLFSRPPRRMVDARARTCPLPQPDRRRRQTHLPDRPTGRTTLCTNRQAHLTGRRRAVCRRRLSVPLPRRHRYRAHRPDPDQPRVPAPAEGDDAADPG